MTSFWSAHCRTKSGTLLTKGTVSMALTCTAPSMRPEARSSPRRSTSKHFFSLTRLKTVIGSMCSMPAMVGTLFGHGGGTYGWRPVCGIVSELVADACCETDRNGSCCCCPPVGSCCTNCVPSCIASSSATWAASPSARDCTGRPIPSQARKPPESIATRWCGSACCLYQFAHCGARCAEYWQVKTMRGCSAHCCASSWMRPRMEPAPIAGMWMDPSMRPAARSSPRTSTRMQLSSSSRL
mmetsp:Transcript_109465/g.309384  ORF Transcript_109465/g.309384 Transcript_109465/m.309384 type:complete len:240 (+) Transcript_109465:411-1130(+)